MMKRDFGFIKVRYPSLEKNDVVLERVGGRPRLPQDKRAGMGLGVGLTIPVP